MLQFTKRLPCLSGMPYNQRVDTLGLQTLELRRLIMDLVYCYKIVFGLTCLDMNDFLSSVPHEPNVDIHMFVPFTSRNCRQHFFSVHVIEPSNSLKFKSNDFASVKRFMSALQRTDLTPSLKYFN